VSAEEPFSPAALLALAFPERIAKARGKRGEFLMANGRAAAVAPESSLAGAPYLAIGEATGRAAATRILLAAPLVLDEVEKLGGKSIETSEETVFDRVSQSLRARRLRRLGAIVLSEQTLAVAPSADNSALLAKGLIAQGLERLPWSKETKQWRDRVAFLARAEPGEWPDLSDGALRDPEWLAAFLANATSHGDVTPALLAEALEAQLPHA
jgi:ATP-dependent helicase HrpB